MGSIPLLWRHQGIGRFLRTVMNEVITIVTFPDQTRRDRFVDMIEDRVVISFGDDRQGGSVELVSDAGRDLERFLDVGGELLEPAHQQFDNAGSDALVPQGIHVPTPVAGGGIEGDEALIFHPTQHLAGEKRVSICL